MNSPHRDTPVLQRFRLDGRSALVTGAGRGIGRAIAIGLAEAGADVCVTSRSAAELASACEQITALGRRATAVTADLLDPLALAAIVPAMVAELGSVDILVNNAGQAGLKDPFADVPMSDWEARLRLLLTVHVALTQQAVRWMTGAGRPGAIVNVSSIYGLAGSPGGERNSAPSRTTPRPSTGWWASPGRWRSSSRRRTSASTRCALAGSTPR